MIYTHLTRRSLLGVLIALPALWSTDISVASAESPWWQLASDSRPSNLPSGHAQEEVDEVKVSAVGGEFLLIDVEAGAFPSFKWDATAGEVQAGLEPIFGAGNVTVAGGPGDTEGTKPYVITSRWLPTPESQMPLNAFGLLSCSTPEEPEVVVPGCKGEATLTHLASGKADGEVIATALNLGDANANGTITVADKLPEGVHAMGLSGVGVLVGTNIAKTLECSRQTLSCKLIGPLAPHENVELRIPVAVDPGVITPNEVSVSGSEVPSASLTRDLNLSNSPTPFGFQDNAVSLEEEGGTPGTQAGAHPFQLTTTVTSNQTADVVSSGLPRDLKLNLPTGLIGDPTAVPRCTLGQFVASVQETSELVNACPPDTAIGIATITVNVISISSPIRGYGNVKQFIVPIFNIEPQPGEPARFGFLVPEGSVPVYLDTAVRTGGDYGVTVNVESIPQTVSFLSSVVSIWGAPDDPRHASQRGWGCIAQMKGESHTLPCNAPSAQQAKPFLRLPTSCSGPLSLTTEADSWESPGSFISVPQTAQLPAMDGCNRLAFNPSISVTPEAHAASTPTGLNVSVHVPQDASQNTAGLGVADVKEIVVRLPEGVVLNPAAADGLQACSEEEVGYLAPPLSTPPDELHFTAGLPTPFCPDAAKVGTVKLKVPILPNPLEGSVYLAAQDANPFGSLIAMYIIAKDPVSGVLVKLAGSVSLDPSTGRITAVTIAPQAPFEDAELHFFGGERAPLATPALCGSYTTEATFTPWSGGSSVKSLSSFPIETGVSGGPCPGAAPFAPSLVAGASDIQAGGFSALTTTISRTDGSQDLQAVKLQTPPGFSGVLTGVKLCQEAQANAGTCGAESLIGHTTVSVGLGGSPFTVTGGRVYLTEHYHGAPFGLSIVTPAKAGPFDLGTVIVRATLEVDPQTAQITVATDAGGERAIPRMLKGIPLQIKRVNVTIDRSGFTFNPTNCNALQIQGTFTSAQGASATASVPFRVANCATLKFAPKFAASTNGRTSKALGASLKVRLSYPRAPFGTQTNITKVKVDLPLQLPSQLKTLQKACLAKVFEANPAGCPSASIVGHAQATTPVLPVPLSGPAYFVSHGGEAFPSLVILLQGYGVTVELVGSTLIRHGITSSTFKTVPDVPVSTFELTLPQGKYSALATYIPVKARGRLCGQKLVMPTLIVAQNGAEISRKTPISVTGCKRAKTHKAKSQRKMRRK